MAKHDEDGEVVLDILEDRAAMLDAQECRAEIPPRYRRDRTEMRSSHAQEREEDTHLEPVAEPAPEDASVSYEKSVKIRGGTASSSRLNDPTRKSSGVSRLIAGSGRITAPGGVKGEYTEDLTFVAIEVCYEQPFDGE